MSHINLLVKPASSNCNMRCRYCFYEDEATKRSKANMGIMTGRTAKILIEQTLEAAGDKGNVSIAFQGGEPTLAGLDFYREFVAYVEQKNNNGLMISYALQTNAYQLDSEWAAFLAEKKFLVGISLDGDKSLHDEFRIDAAGKGTWQRIQKNIRLLQDAGVDCNLLCVVTKRCAKGAIRTYHALQKTGIRYLQFIPCLDPLGEERGHRPWSLIPKVYGDFLCALFDEWYRDWEKGKYISIRLFEDYVHLAMKETPSTCATNGKCGAYFVVEADGSVYPCDFYVLDQWQLGDINQTTLKEIGKSSRAKKFLSEGLKKPYECENCRWKCLCFGGCKRDYVLTENGNIHNYYCEAYQRFFEYAESRINVIANCERQMRSKSILNTK